MKFRTYIYCLLTIVFVSCETIGEWFYHTVDYQGNSLDPKMVVSAHLQAGNRPEIFVNTAYFIEDSLRMDTDTFLVWTDEYGNEEASISKGIRKGYLHNADVQMRVNNGEWMTLHEEYKKFFPDKKWVSDAYYMAYLYTCDYLIQPGDSVELRVRDESLKAEATAQQRVPDKVMASVSDVETYDMTIESSLQLCQFNLHLPACTRDADVLRLKFTCYTSQTYHTQVRDYDEQTHTFSELRDTVIVSSELIPGTFGQDVCFERYDNMCSRLSHGWYGSEIGLYMDAPSEPMTIPVCAYFMKEQDIDWGIYWSSQASDAQAHLSERTKVACDGDNSTHCQTDSIVVELQMFTREAYLYAASMVAAEDYNYLYEIDDPWRDDNYGPGEEIVDMIEDIFDEMGSLEPIPIFGNVNGAIGHVTAGCSSHLVMIPQSRGEWLVQMRK